MRHARTGGPTRGGRLRSFGLFGALAVALAAALLALAGRVGPASPAILLISLGLPALAPMALLAAMIVALAALQRLRWSAIAIAFLSAALLADSLRPMLARDLPVPNGDDAVIRIVSFNAWTLNRDPIAASRWIESQRPDAVVLLEASGSASLIVARLARTFPYRVTCRGVRPCSTIILSRWPLLSAKGLAHGDADNRRALSAAFARIATPHGLAPLLALHFSRPTSPASQLHEINLLLNDMAAVSKDDLIVAGDFNLPPWSRALRQVADRLGVREADGAPGTWPVPGMGQTGPAIWPIDHVLLGPRWSAARVTRGPALGSDHYPLLAEIARNEVHGGH